MTLCTSVSIWTALNVFICLSHDCWLAVILSDLIWSYLIWPVLTWCARIIRGWQRPSQWVASQSSTTLKKDSTLHQKTPRSRVVHYQSFLPVLDLLHYYYHFMALYILPRTTWVSQYQKGITKTYLDFIEQETVSYSGISWAICKCAPFPSQIRQHPTTHFLQARCPSCRSTNSVKALKANQSNMLDFMSIFADCVNWATAVISLNLSVTTYWYLSV